MPVWTRWQRSRQKVRSPMQTQTSIWNGKWMGKVSTSAMECEPQMENIASQNKRVKYIVLICWSIMYHIVQQKFCKILQLNKTKHKIWAVSSHFETFWTTFVDQSTLYNNKHTCRPNDQFIQYSAFLSRCPWQQKHHYVSIQVPMVTVTSLYQYRCLWQQSHHYVRMQMTTTATSLPVCINFTIFNSAFFSHYIDTCSISPCATFHVRQLRPSQELSM